MEFFQVTAKCGHVGRGQFYMGLFYVRAENGCAAAAIVRYMPRVKHNHKDAILAVVKVGYEEYKTGQAATRKNPYFKCRSIQEQRACMEEIEESIHIETDSGERQRGREDRYAKLEAVRRAYRKANKYGYKNYDIGA